MADQSLIIRHQAAVGATPVQIDFGVGVQKVYLTTVTADVLVEFNGSANTDSFRVVQNTSTVEFEFPGTNVRTLSLLGSGGTANVYVIGVVA